MDRNGDSSVAFFSYVRVVDDHDDGKLSEFRKRLEGEVSVQIGKPFHIFQDRNDIAWGQKWRDRIAASINSATLLIPIVTPGFFNSPACRDEFKAFEEREATLGVFDLILPIYYITADPIEKYDETTGDPIAKTIRTRNWVDWRKYRFRDLRDNEVSFALAVLAETIKSRLDNLASVRVAAATAQFKAKAPEISPRQKQLDLPTAVAFEPEVRELSILGTSRRAKLPASLYYAYTKRFDEVVRPQRLAKPADLTDLHALLTTLMDKHSASYGAQISARIAEIGAKTKGKKVLVTILIDNSGSMRGRPIAETASWAHLVSEILEQNGVLVEVLGYTTRAWKGGQSRELWLANGKPRRPGRLNDLRHIIYKSSDETTRAVALNFAVMLKEGILKENIDGEAILWAFDRLKKIKADTKILVVFADGAPVDDSTLSVNPNGLLHRHMLSAVRWIECQPEYKIIGIGIGYDTKRYFSNSVEAYPEEVGIAALQAVNDSL